MDERVRSATGRGAGAAARGELSQVEAAECLGLSYRQTKRLYGPYREQGAEGLWE